MQDTKIDKVKFLKPHFHFKTSLTKIGDDYTTNKITVTEFVKANDLLASFKNFQIYQKDGYQKAPLEPGENCTFADDEESIVASVSGYPKVIRQKVKGVSEFLSIISIEPLIVVSQDSMMATICLHPQIEEASPLTIDIIQDAITHAGIVHGISDAALLKIQNILEKKEVEFTKTTFAKGTPVGESIDSYLRFDMEIGPIAGTILKNGSIDFRDRKIMVGVNQGQCIATKIPAITGDPGINIFDEKTPARTPVDIKVQPLNDAKFLSDSNQVIAKKAGVLSIVNGSIIKVLSHQLITSDIDYKTGNVDSMNCVTIEGSVQPGFKVNAVGDLKIGGGVMSGHVTSDANLVIHGGITGKKSEIISTGDCDINFIEQGKLNCGGVCVIRKQSYYSDITANADIRCKPESKIMGGTLFAGGSMTLYDVGGNNSEPSHIAAGVVPQRLQEYEELVQNIVDQEEAIIQWLQRYKGSSTSKKIRTMEKEVAETKLKRIRFNMIPGTGIYSRAAGPDDVADSNDEDYSDEGGIDINQVTIDVLGTVHRDTKIRIGNRSLKLEKTVTSRQFKLHPSSKRIIAVPLKKG